jgi:16S rRNA processing protein RimM
MMKLKNPVLLGIVGAAHGIKGEVRVKTFTGDPLALADYGPLHARTLDLSRSSTYVQQTP